MNISSCFIRSAIVFGAAIVLFFVAQLTSNYSLSHNGKFSDFISMISWITVVIAIIIMVIAVLLLSALGIIWMIGG